MQRARDRFGGVGQGAARQPDHVVEVIDDVGEPEVQRHRHGVLVHLGDRAGDVVEVGPGTDVAQLDAADATLGQRGEARVDRAVHGGPIGCLTAIRRATGHERRRQRATE